MDIESLNAAQAQQAMLILYDLLPNAAWSGGTKASLHSFEGLGENLRDAAAPGSDSARLVAGLLDEGHDEIKGAVARQMLRLFAGEPAMRPLVDTAVSRARESDMATLPLIVGACILGLSLLPRAEITEENGRRTTKWVFDPPATQPRSSGSSPSW